MAKAFVEVVGDSASAVRALEQTSAALTATGDAAKVAAVDMDAYAAASARAQATRAETLLAQAGSLRQLSTSGTVSGTEAAAANAAAVKRQTQAYKLLGIQAAATGKSMTETAGTIGRGLTTYATVPAAFIGYEAVKQALDFNQALLLIRTQAGASQAELQHMNSSVLQLVQSGHSYGQTAQQMANSLFYVESEGIRGGRALATLQAAAAGAAKGQTDMADTTNALTSAMKIWNVSADGAAKTMATIDAITATGKMHLQDLNEAFNTRFFSTAQAIGVPLEQAGALLDVFTKMGVPASSAATNLTTTFIRMVNPAKGAAASLQQLGLTTGQLGRDLQTGGITKALADLTQGYSKLVQTQGPAAGEAAVFGAFGGSHGGGAALQAIKGYQSYLESLGQIQRLNNPATFWSQVSETMQQPANQVRQSVAEIGADFIKLGTALAPTVATLAGGVAKISSAFSDLPGPIKDAIGVVVGILAIGGPLGLAISGVGKLVGGIGTAFGLLGPSAAAGVVGADTALTGLTTNAEIAEAKVSTLRGTLLGLAGRIFTVTIVADILYHYRNQLANAAAGAAHHLGAGPSHGGQPGPLAFLEHPLRTFFYSPAAHDTHSGKGPHPHRQTSHETNAQADLARDELHRVLGSRDNHGRKPSAPPPPLYQLPAVPQHIQLDMAKAQAGRGSLPKAQEEERKWLLKLIQSGRLKGQALVQAYQALASLQTKAVTDAQKAQSQFDQTVRNDALLARARNDLAQGEVSAAQHLLSLDQQRLQSLLVEAKTSQERDTVLKQLAEVNRLRHSKSSAFALSPRLQMEIARADAEAALNPSTYGPDATQIQLAKQAKAAALKAIHSHELTLQGLTAAWQIVGQENSILAQAKGDINTYHAVYSKAITDSVKGLTHIQDLELRERISQAEAHRGYAPNRGEGGQHHTHRVDVHVHSNDSHIVKVVNKHNRNQQRAGGRR